MADAFTNFAKSTLAGGLAPATTALTVQVGDGALFPAAGAGQTFRFVLQNTANQREVCVCTLRTGDVFNTILRNQEGTTALTWNAGDRIGHRLTAAQLNNILFSSDLQQNTKTWCGTAGGTANALTLTPAPAVTAMVAGHKFIFKTGAAANTTPVTISVSGLATFAAQNAGAALVAGALTASTWWEVLYDGAAGQLKKYSLAVEASVFTAKGSLVSASAASTPTERTVGSDGQAVHADSSQTSGLVYIDNPSRPNLLVNPNWQLDQINEGALYTINGAAANGPDGWSGEAVGGGGGVFKLRTLADPDNAALKCLEITCTTIDAAIAAGERYSIFAAVEGFDAAALQAGVASAQSVTLQFKYKTSVAGVYGVSLANSAKTRSYVGIINVADANEHEYSLIVPMDVAGAWLYTNGVGLYLRLTLAGGANFQAVAGAWNAADNYCTAAQANFMSNIANIAYLKRIQLIPGALVQAYRPADIQKELAKAQRQYCKTFSQGQAVGAGLTQVGCLTGLCINATCGPRQNFQFPAEMRAAPAVTTYHVVTGGSADWRSVAAGTDDTASVANVSTREAIISSTTAAAPTHYEQIQAAANARLS